MNAKEYIIGASSNYQYGMFYQEKDNKWYISDDTIDYIISKINWKFNDLEKEYIKAWKRFEEFHRNYCLGLITNDKYEELIQNGYSEYEENTGYEFGERVDELLNHIIRYL